jgi:hypothetical protein
MTLQEMLGENYREDMTIAEISEAVSKLKLADLSKGEYVAKGKLTEAEGKLTKVENDFKEYKASKQTEEEKKIEAENAEKERVQGIEKELETYKAKSQLADNGYSAEEIKYLMENQQSPSAFAKVMADRVQSASEKAKGKDIKENINLPDGGNGNLNTEPTSLKDALKEKFNS